MAALVLRVATSADSDAIKALMRISIEELQGKYLTPAQLQSSQAAMGLDRILVEDGTYFVIHDGSELVGCGGWSFRGTLYGWNFGKGPDERALDPATDRAKIRAMYTHPAHTGRGIGRMILEAGEAAARDYGFREIELAASVAGKPFYLRCGYEIEYEWLDERDGEPVPLTRMVKLLTSS